MTGSLRRITVADILLLAAVVVLPALSLSAARGGARRVRISVAGRPATTWPLDTNRMLDLGNGMTVEIRGGRVRVSESDCPRGLCRQAGWVATPGRTIACLPNRTIIEVVAPATDCDVETH